MRYTCVERKARSNEAALGWCGMWHLPIEIGKMSFIQTRRASPIDITRVRTSMRFSVSKCARVSQSTWAMVPSAEVISSRALASFCAICVSRDARERKYHQSTQPEDYSSFCLESIVSPPLRQIPTIPHKGLFPGRHGVFRSCLTVRIEFSC